MCIIENLLCLNIYNNTRLWYNMRSMLWFGVQSTVYKVKCVVINGKQAYSTLNHIRYIHKTVNNNKNFIDPETGTYTQFIKGT